MILRSSCSIIKWRAATAQSSFITVETNSRYARPSRGGRRRRERSGRAQVATRNRSPAPLPSPSWHPGDPGADVERRRPCPPGATARPRDHHGEARPARHTRNEVRRSAGKRGAHRPRACPSSSRSRRAGCGRRLRARRSLRTTREGSSRLTLPVKPKHGEMPTPLFRFRVGARLLMLKFGLEMIDTETGLANEAHARGVCPWGVAASRALSYKRRHRRGCINDVMLVLATRRAGGLRHRDQCFPGDAARLAVTRVTPRDPRRWFVSPSVASPSVTIPTSGPAVGATRAGLVVSG